MNLKKTIFLGACSLASLIALAENNPRRLRETAISPDGTTIAFTYKGDIFTVSFTGGEAKQITAGPYYDTRPVWSPSGEEIVFESNREGSTDIYITSSKGGTPRRLTVHSGNETPLTFLNDSILLFNATLLPGNQTARAPYFTQVYSINTNLDFPRPNLYLSVPMLSADASSNGDLIYQDKKGYEDIYRKHERSSGTTDIWTYRDGKFTQLTDFNGMDTSPVWGQGETYYYLSEEDGTINVYKGETTGKEKQQLTHFTKHPVRSLSSSSNGKLAFSQDGDVYSLIPGEEPQKLNIIINADQYDADRVKKYVSDGVTEIAVSPDGSEIAMVIRGEIYVTDPEFKTTKRITNTPSQERSLSYSPDGTTIVFDSDTDGHWQLYLAKLNNKEDKSFSRAADIKIEPLYSCETSAMQPVFSPDGKKVAFLENRTILKVIDIETKNTVTALDGKYNYSYTDGDIPFSWSPDSQWLLVSYFGKGGWNNIDVAVAKADGTEVVDLTESGYSDMNPKWALNGKGITYTSGRYGMKAHGSWGNQEDVILMVLDSEAWDNFNLTEEEIALIEKEKGKEADKEEQKKKKISDDKKQEEKKTILDLKNRKYRTRRLTGNSSNLLDYYLTPKGDKLYYIAEATEGDFNLMVTDLKKGDTKVLQKDVTGMFYPDSKEEKIFILTSAGPGKLNLDEGTVEAIEFEAPYDRHPSLERQYIFDHFAKQVEDKFYDVNLHGVDWKYYTDHYREFLPYISNNHDFEVMMCELLGELNASHTGGRYINPGAKMSTSSLGIFTDDTYDGEGIKIAEILPAVPLASMKNDVKAGDVILEIDGEKIEKGKDYFRFLEGKNGKKTRLKIRKASGEEKYIETKPISSPELTNLAYKRWIERNEQIVDSLSEGKIGYIHVREMDGRSFQNAYDRLLGKYRNCDAVVVDTRYNSGGWLHNDLVLLLGGKEYVKFEPRGQYVGHEPFSQWAKPSVMLINESNYSDAHGTPYSYKALGIGELVGAPVPGTMTAVWWETQIDPTLVFGIPQVTNVAVDGTVLENTQLNPDLLIYNDPGDIENGRDAQLEEAVKRLLENK